MDLSNKDVLSNNDYRKFLYTSSKMQIVTMSLNPFEEIPRREKYKSDQSDYETHDVDQFFMVVKGKIIVSVGMVYNGKKEVFTKILKENDMIVVPSGAKHNVINPSKTKDAKILTIYAPRQHY